MMLICLTITAYKWPTESVLFLFLTLFGHLYTVYRVPKTTAYKRWNCQVNRPANCCHLIPSNRFLDGVPVPSQFAATKLTHYSTMPQRTADCQDRRETKRKPLEMVRILAPNDTAYKRWSCHSGLKLLCKLYRTSQPPAMGARFTFFFWYVGHADPLDGWRCCSQKRVMSRPIQVRQL